jgi:hypothetical protein
MLSSFFDLIEIGTVFRPDCEYLAAQTGGMDKTGLGAFILIASRVKYFILEGERWLYGHAIDIG